MSSSIDVEGLFFIAEEEVATDDRPCMRPRQIRRVYVEKKMHIAGVVGDAIVSSCRCVAESPVGGSEDLLCRVSLLGCDFVCDREERGVDCTGVV